MKLISVFQVVRNGDSCNHSTGSYRNPPYGYDRQYTSYIQLHHPSFQYAGLCGDEQEGSTFKIEI